MLLFAVICKNKFCKKLPDCHSQKKRMLVQTIVSRFGAVKGRNLPNRFSEKDKAEKVDEKIESFVWFSYWHLELRLLECKTSKFLAIFLLATAKN